MRERVLLAAAVFVLATACGGDGDGKIKVAIPADHVAAVNAAVPAEWKDKLVFELGAVVDKRGRTVDTYRFAAPKGWVPAFMPGSLKPGDADDFGRSEALKGNFQMKVGSNCDGECTDKDWAAVVDKVYYQRFTGGEAKGKVLKDEKTDTARLVVFMREPVTETQGTTVVTSGDKGVNILRTWWTKGGKQFFTCEVDLGEGMSAPAAPLEGLISAFEKACSLVSAE